MEEQHKERKASYKYSFRLDEQQNIRFCRMLAEAGLEHNRSRFIVKRIFAEEFRVVRIDPTLGRYVTRLNQFYEQIQRVATTITRSYGPSTRIFRIRRFRDKCFFWSAARAS